MARAEDKGRPTGDLLLPRNRPYEPRVLGPGKVMMRAAVFSAFGGPEVLEVVDVPVPPPGDGEIRVAVHACGVNPFDHKQRRGMFGGTPPIRVGVEIAGIVDAVGDDVTDVSIGDGVYGFAVGGGAADFALSKHYAPVPAALDFATAAAMPVAIETSYRVLDLVDLPRGATVLVNGGSGAVGQALVQLARAGGAQVIATGEEANHPLLVGLGARPVTCGHGLAGRIRDLGVSSVDAAIDAGGGGVLGELVSLTGATDQVVTIVPDPAVQALGVRISGGNSAFHGLTDIAALIDKGEYRPPATTLYALADVAVAQERSKTGHPGGTKLVLVP